MMQVCIMVHLFFGEHKSPSIGYGVIIILLYNAYLIRVGYIGLVMLTTFAN